MSIGRDCGDFTHIGVPLQLRQTLIGMSDPPTQVSVWRPVV